MSEEEDRLLLAREEGREKQKASTIARESRMHEGLIQLRVGKSADDQAYVMY